MLDGDRAGMGTGDRTAAVFVDVGPGEFVLFRGLEVVAVSEGGALDVRESAATAGSDPFEEEEY